jgi:hypothetical protein
MKRFAHLILSHRAKLKKTAISLFDRLSKSITIQYTTLVSNLFIVIYNINHNNFSFPSTNTNIKFQMHSIIDYSSALPQTPENDIPHPNSPQKPRNPSHQQNLPFPPKKKKPIKLNCNFSPNRNNIQLFLYKKQKSTNPTSHK